VRYQGRPSGRPWRVLAKPQSWAADRTGRPVAPHRGHVAWIVEARHDAHQRASAGSVTTCADGTHTPTPPHEPSAVLCGSMVCHVPDRPNGEAGAGSWHAGQIARVT